jgi:hypothetical protein
MLLTQNRLSSCLSCPLLYPVPQQDKTCKAVGKDNTFQYRLLCKQDCSNKYTCQEPSFDKSKCAGQTTPVTTFVALGQKCGYVQDNKSYACGGNHVSCQNGVCVSTLPGK